MTQTTTQTTTIPGILQRAVDSVPVDELERFKSTGHFLVGAWVCLELGAQREPVEAVKAVRVALGLLQIHVQTIKSTRRDWSAGDFWPFLPEEGRSALGLAAKQAEGWPPEPQRTETGNVADLTLAMEPEPDTPPGYVRIVARLCDAQSTIVFDRTMDPIEANDVLPRLMEGDPQLVDAPLIIQPVRNMPEVGRNAPCPCGSGRKYKKCCLTGGQP